ncbi:DUF3093 domain-containing protein [Streptomyces sp. JHA26]|uniref:DUF3093 domain-containing protein n=1 Tax=Streptomyces sp. JHA26 TaxID=1917143 RepID=UPI00098B5FF4|nr:DUF3093 domain-containing protein [Streptomyces sp. JHA26]
MRLYEERLGVPRAAFWLAALLSVMAAVVLLPFGTVAAVTGLVVVAALTALGLHAYGAAAIVVTDRHLTAGSIRFPLTALGMAEILDAEEAFLWRTRRADVRARMLLRSHVPTALRIEIDDPDCPAPYLYLSTRQPTTLLAVLSFARR